MAYDEIQVAGAANSKILEVMVRDSTTGMGKTGLAYGGVTYGYWREGAATGANGTCVTMTKGTYTDHGWIEVDATNQPGVYQFGVPDAALATGVKAVTISLKASGIIDKVMRILIVASDLRTAVAVATTALSNAMWTDTKAGYLSGDAYTRLGAPAGASVSADMAAIKTEVHAAHQALCGKVVIDRSVTPNTIKIYDTNGSSVLIDLTFATAANVDTIDLAV